MTWVHVVCFPPIIYVLLEWEGIRDKGGEQIQCFSPRNVTLAIHMQSGWAGMVTALS